MNKGPFGSALELCANTLKGKVGLEEVTIWPLYCDQRLEIVNMTSRFILPISISVAQEVVQNMKNRVKVMRNQ